VFNIWREMYLIGLNRRMRSDLVDQVDGGGRLYILRWKSSHIINIDNSRESSILSPILMVGVWWILVLDRSPLGRPLLTRDSSTLPSCGGGDWFISYHQYWWYEEESTSPIIIIDEWGGMLLHAPTIQLYETETGSLLANIAACLREGFWSLLNLGRDTCAYP